VSHLSILFLHDNLCIGSKTLAYIKSDALPEIAYQTANHFLMLARELFWENIRLAEFPDAPSRQKCIWLIESLDDVNRWITAFDFNPVQCSVAKVRATGRALKVDSNNLIGDSDPLPIWYEKARLYWAGTESTNPLPEVVFEGSLVVEKIIDSAAFLTTA